MTRNPFRINPHLPPQERNALRAILIGLPATVLAACVYLALAIQSGAWQLYAWSADIWVLALIVLVGYFMLRRGRLTSAIWLILIAIQVTFIAAVALIEGIGWLIGISILALVSIIGGQTLPARQASLAAALGVVSGIIAILLEVYLPAYRLPPPPLLRIFLPAILISVILLFGHVTANQFRNYTLRVKLIIVFVTLVLSSAGVSAFLATNAQRVTLTNTIGEQLNILANSKAVEIGQALERQADILETLSFNPFILNAVSAANTQGALTEEEIIRRDTEWRSAASDTDPLISSVLNNNLSLSLRQFQHEFPEHVEMFVTSLQGVNIAATNRTSDYYQGDETWWRSAINDGIYIGQPQYDESSNVTAIILAVRIGAADDAAPLGVLRTTLNLSFLTPSLTAGLFGESGHTDIYLPNGQELSLRMKEDGSYETILKTASLNINELLRSEQVYQQTFHDETPIIASPALVSGPDLPGEHEEKNAIAKLAWYAVSIQSQAEAFQPIRAQVRTNSLFAIAVSLGAILAAIGFSQVLSAPLIRLKQVVDQITAGDTSIQAQVETGDESGALAAAFNQMTSQLRSLIASLEQRVSERTIDLKNAVIVSEKRAQDLQSISEISRIISAEQRLDILLPLVTRLISERFGFYHVGIFIIDETRRFALLQAANSQGGQKLLDQGYRLELGSGLIGLVAQSGKPRIALDLDAETASNPHLPDTRSAMALPLKYRGVTIGVLDVQSAQPNAFTESDANTLGILADQVAITIQNARLFSQMQQAREEAEALYTQIQRREWNAFLRQEGRIGYQQTASGGKRLTQPVFSGEIRKALKDGQVVVVEGENTQSQPAIAVPLKLRGQTIGVLNIKAPLPNRRWSQDEINLAQTISDRLALALDNARLLIESQRRAAKEAKISEVSAKIGASINLQNILQTAVEELGRALPGSEVIIQFGDTDGESSA
jgi:GAF domain-containing protein/HAMP domain-containing protein